MCQAIRIGVKGVKGLGFRLRGFRCVHTEGGESRHEDHVG